MVNIVTFNGGRGARNLIPSFLKMEGINLTCVVNAYDDGKSTGIIRSFFKMLRPSDIRKVQEVMVAKHLIDYDSIVKAFEFRYAIDAKREDVLGDISAFVEGKKNDISHIEFKDQHIKTSLKQIFKKLLGGIELIEKAESRQLDFSDCSLMNLAYAGAYLQFGGNFETTTIFFDKLFQLQGTVLPTNNEDKKLVGIREDGTVLFSEAEIVELRSNVRVKKIYLLDEYPDRSIINKLTTEEITAYFELKNKQVVANPKVVRVISDADIIIYSPGTQHSSLYPSYITQGVTDAIASNKTALKIFITNIGEDYETPSYTANDYLIGALKYLKIGANYSVATSDLIDVALVNKMFSQKTENYVKYDLKGLNEIGCKIIIDDFEDLNLPGRHNGITLSKTIIDLYNNSDNKNII